MDKKPITDAYKQNEGYSTRSGRICRRPVAFTIEHDDEEDRRIREEERLWEIGQSGGCDDGPVKVPFKCRIKCNKVLDRYSCKNRNPDDWCPCECHECGCDDSCDLDECECECHDDDSEMDGFVADEEEELDRLDDESEYSEEDEGYESDDSEYDMDLDDICESDDLCKCSVNLGALKCKLTRKDDTACDCSCHDEDDSFIGDEPKNPPAKKSRLVIESESESHSYIDYIGTPPRGDDYTASSDEFSDLPGLLCKECNNASGCICGMPPLTYDNPAEREEAIHPDEASPCIDAPIHYP
jgi:hypothetical protein